MRDAKLIGQNLKVMGSFYWWKFSRRGTSSFGVPGGRGLGSVSRGRGGVVPLWKIKEKGKGVGRVGGWGGDRQRNRQVNAHAFAKPPFINERPLE